MSCRITCVRHVQRVKKGPGAEEQRLSEAGLLTAWVMGRIIRGTLGENFRFPIPPSYHSPQPRSRHTCLLLLRSFVGDEETQPYYCLDDLRESTGLNDYSTDERGEVKVGMTTAKAIAKDRGVEVEAAMFLCDQGLTAVGLKTKEAMAVIDEVTADGTRKGHYFFGGLHGCTIDGLHALMLRRTGTDCGMGTSKEGGIFDYGEGFTVGLTPIPNPVDGGETTSFAIECFRQPPYLKAALAAMSE